jgi:hypothetical protein
MHHMNDRFRLDCLAVILLARLGYSFYRLNGKPVNEIETLGTLVHVILL